MSKRLAAVERTKYTREIKLQGWFRSEPCRNSELILSSPLSLQKQFVEQGNEPEEFKAFFVAWDPEIFKIEEPGNLFTRAQGRQGWQGSKTFPWDPFPPI